MDITDFSEQVIKRSYTIPVLVDFWAKWCSACKILSPTLEILRERHKDEWVLAKVEVEQHPELAVMYNITSIPSVKLFVDGDIVGEFSGAVPGHVIENWLKDVLPPKQQRDIHNAERLIREGHETKAQQILSKVLNEDTGNKEAEVLYAKSIVLRKPADALDLIKNMDVLGLPGDTIDAIRTIAKFLTRYRISSELPPSPAKPIVSDAITALVNHDFDTALQKLIDSLKADPQYLDGLLKDVCIALFNYLGEDSKLTIKYRHLFGRILF